MAALVEAVEEIAIRSELVGRLRNSLSDWIGPPTEVFLLGSKQSQMMAWADAAPLNERELSNDEILFIYFARESEYVVLSISRESRSAVYNLSFPIQGIMAEPDTALDVLRSIYREISAMNIRCVVAAGAELEIDGSSRSVEDVIRSTGDVDSLVSLLCYNSRDASELGGFVSLGEHQGSVVFRRK